MAREKIMQPWIRKFRDAARGIVSGTRGQTSFMVHLPMAALVVGAAWWSDCSLWQWCILLLCISLVLAAELFNSSLESLAKGLCPEYNEQVGKALDMAAGAVLVVSLGAALIGGLVLCTQLFGWAA